MKNGGKSPYAMNNKYVLLLRPHHWVKNLFVFAPLFFGHRFGDAGLLWQSFLAFAAFSLTASGVYALNDIWDLNEDRLHPEKKNRPVATGLVGIQPAYTLSAVFLAAGIWLSMMAGASVWQFILFYALLNIAYTMRLKHLPILDVSIIAIGFVIRLLAGSRATSVPLSVWIVITTFLLSLFLALAKRRDDILLFQKNGQVTRKAMDGYNLDFLNVAMGMMATIVVVAYLMYTVSPDVTGRLHNGNLYLTAFFVLLGVLRYMQIAFVEGNGGNPTTALFKDRSLQAIIAGWVLAFGWILYW